MGITHKIMFLKWFCNWCLKRGFQRCPKKVHFRARDPKIPDSGDRPTSENPSFLFYVRFSFLRARESIYILTAATWSVRNPGIPGVPDPRSQDPGSRDPRSRGPGSTPTLRSLRYGYVGFTYYVTLYITVRSYARKVTLQCLPLSRP